MIFSGCDWFSEDSNKKLDPEEEKKEIKLVRETVENFFEELEIGNQNKCELIYPNWSSIDRN